MKKIKAKQKETKSRKQEIKNKKLKEKKNQWNQKLSSKRLKSIWSYFLIFINLFFGCIGSLLLCAGFL